MKSVRSAVGAPSAIIAFEAAGRHLNFTRAAEELNVSQPAISRQIRNLELHVGQALFDRRGNKVRLTAKGQILFDATTTSFRHIVSAIDNIRPRPGKEALVFRSVPIIFSTFILPLYMDLQNQFPDIPIDMETMENAAPINREVPSVSILYGTGDWPDLESELLLEEICFPICHPLLLKESGSTDPEELLDRLPLLQVSSYVDDWMDWRTWGAHFQLKCLSSKRPQLINDYEMLLQACRSGHGVAIGSLYMVGHSLREGLLVRATDLCIRSKFGFYLIYDRQLVLDDKYARLINWIREAARKTQQKYLPMLPENTSGHTE